MNIEHRSGDRTSLGSGTQALTLSSTLFSSLVSFIVIQQRLAESLLCAKCCSGHGNPARNKVEKNPYSCGVCLFVFFFGHTARLVGS